MSTSYEGEAAMRACRESLALAESVSAQNKAIQAKYNREYTNIANLKEIESRNWEAAEKKVQKERQKCEQNKVGDRQGGLLNTGADIVMGKESEVNCNKTITNTYQKKKYEFPALPVFLPTPTIVCQHCYNEISMLNNTDVSTGEIAQAASCVANLDGETVSTNEQSNGQSNDQSDEQSNDQSNGQSDDQSNGQSDDQSNDSIPNIVILGGGAALLLIIMLILVVIVM